MSTYAIGDLHGCYSEWMVLLDKLSFNPAQDTLWLVGDLVNRGPDSLACLREAERLGSRVRCVLGNHDFHLLVAARGGGKVKKHASLEAVLAAPDRERLLDWLQSQPLAVHEGNRLMTHAGLLPQWDLAQVVSLSGEVQAALMSETSGRFLNQLYGNHPAQWSNALDGMDRLRCIVNVLTRMRFIDAAGRLDFDANQGLESAPPGFAPWFQFPRDDDPQLVFGHWAALGGETPGARVRVDALDTGCAWGGKLTALDLATGERTSVPSHQSQGSPR